MGVGLIKAISGQQEAELATTSENMFRMLWIRHSSGYSALKCTFTACIAKRTQHIPFLLSFSPLACVPWQWLGWSQGRKPLSVQHLPLFSGHCLVTSSATGYLEINLKLFTFEKPQWISPLSAQQWLRQTEA